ncbi:MAG: hypothetical protein WC297_01270 [Candidatus Paceibacterota bacterium]|jgi:hypothetical protein
MAKWKATYRKEGVNPFNPNYWELGNSIGSITTKEVPDDTPRKEIEKFARKVTPKGYRFVKVEKVT